MHPRHAKIKAPVGATRSVTVNIVPEKKYAFKILDTKAEKGENISFALKETKREDQTAYELVVKNTNIKTGRYFDTIKLKTDSTIQPELSVWVFVDIKDTYK